MILHRNNFVSDFIFHLRTWMINDEHHNILTEQLSRTKVTQQPYRQSTS